MEVVLARAGYSASRRCFRIMLLRDHETANQPRCGSPGRDPTRRGQPGAGDRAARAGRRALRRVADPDLGSHHALLFDAAREGDRGQSRSRGSARAGPRSSRARRPDPAAHDHPGPGPFGAPSAASDRARHVPVNNPRRAANTIRTHLRDIDPKLGVHGRAEAVARARESSGPSHHPTGARQR